MEDKENQKQYVPCEDYKYMRVGTTIYKEVEKPPLSKKEKQC